MILTDLIVVSLSYVGGHINSFVPLAAIERQFTNTIQSQSGEKKQLRIKESLDRKAYNVELLFSYARYVLE